MRRTRTEWRSAAGRLAVAAAAWAVAGCDDQLNMIEQPVVRTYETSEVFADGAAARPMMEGVVSREGVYFSDAPEASLPPRPALTAELVARGRDLFDISCRPCHGAAGYGDGMVVQRGYPRPPSLHTERLRTIADAHMLRVITHGLGKMPAYVDHVPAGRDRWALVAYVRALQVSQHAALADVPDHARERLDEHAGEAQDAGPLEKVRRRAETPDREQP